MKVSHFDKSVEQRRTESNQIKQSHPNRACVYMVKSKGNFTLPNLDKCKYLVPIDITIGQFAYIIRRRIRLSSTTAMFLMANNSMLSTTATIGEINKKHMDEDGFLYIYYTAENCFG